MLLFLCLSLIITPKTSFAHTNGGYSHDSDVNLNNYNWMSALSDELTINELSIPGTGNSLSYGNFTDFTLTQSMDLETQLKSGIRFLDLGVKHDGDYNLKIYAGSTNLGVDFVDVIRRVGKFLDSHREEVVLIKVSERSSESGTFAHAIRRSLESAGLDHYIFDASNNYNPKLGQVRGKIILLSDYNGNKWRTIPYRQSSNIQDDNHLTTNWDLYSKWEKVKKQLIDANNSNNKGTRYINYLTGSGGAFPYFVASGHSSSGTNAPRLSTGLTEPGFNNYYPDFPRINRVGVFATIAFEGINTLALNHILNNEPNFVGIIVADFPGAGLIKEIIDLNFKDRNNSSGNNNNNNNSSSNNTDGWGFTFKKS